MDVVDGISAKTASGFVKASGEEQTRKSNGHDQTALPENGAR